jgi:hypothetical protein
MNMSMTIQASVFTVTRQCQWPHGDCVVEISQGGVDYSNPDCLSGQYPGEIEEYDGMTDAVEAAIKIAEAWQADERKKPRHKRQPILIAVGNTGGHTMPFEGERLTKKNLAALREKAKEFDDKLPKCDHCGKIIKEKWTHPHSQWNDTAFCSEYCADKAYYDELKYQHKCDLEEAEAEGEEAGKDNGSEEDNPYDAEDGEYGDDTEQQKSEAWLKGFVKGGGKVSEDD